MRARPAMPMPAAAGARSSGFTLIELLIALVVLAAATSGVLLIFANATAHSADPQIRVQARSIAESYLDEILLQPYADPDGSEAGETRATFDDVDDYDGLAEPPTDQFDNPIAGLGAYTVAVTVTDPPGGPATVAVRVTHTSGLVDYTLTGERHAYH